MKKIDIQEGKIEYLSNEVQIVEELKLAEHSMKLVQKVLLSKFICLLDHIKYYNECVNLKCKISLHVKTMLFRLLRKMT